MEDALACSVCMEPYASAEPGLRVPRALACLHTFCTGCTIQISRQTDATAPGTLTCPTCRKDTAFEAGVGSLLRNYQLLEAAEAWALKATVTSTTVMCDCGDAPAVNHCAECAEFLCADPCSTLHAKKSKTKSHVLQTLEEFRAGLESGAAAPAAAARAEYCTDHPRPSELHELTLFCRTCDEPICRDCTVVEHKTHDFIFLESHAGEKRGEIAAMVDEVQARSAAVVAAAEAVDEMKARVAARETAATAEVRRMFRTIMEAVNQRQRACIEAVAAQSHQKRKTLEAQQEGLTGFAASLASSCDYVQQTLDRGSDCQILLAKPVMVARLEELRVQELALEPETTDTLVVGDSTGEPLLAALAAFGEVVACDDVAAAQSIAEGAGVGPGELVLGKEASFTVTLRNAAGEPVAVPPEALGTVLQATGPEGGPVLAVTPGGGGGDDDGASTATVRYTPTVEGELNIDVRVLGGHVPGSPFRVPVVDVRLEIDSEILDGPMTKTLAGMLGAGLWRARKVCGYDSVFHPSDCSVAVFDAAVKGHAQILTLIREQNTRYVFGGFVHDTFGLTGQREWVVGNAENFVFSLGNVTGHPIKLKALRNQPKSIHPRGCGLHMGTDLVAFCSHSTKRQHFTTFAPGYTAAGANEGTMVSGVDGNFNPARMEVFIVE